MKFSPIVCYLLPISLLSLNGFNDSVNAQIIPDGSTPTIIQRNDNIFEIQGGLTINQNLFHSFNQFSINQNTSAYFNNSPNILNIITRVTGDTPTNFDGILQNNNANFILLNPNGINFGSQAQLQIGGSFLGSTAYQINFPDGSYFNTTEINQFPLLTIRNPVSLQFNQNSGSIVLQSAFLEVNPNQTLALLGNNINLNNSKLIAPSGRVELGSVGSNSLVNFTFNNKGFAFDYNQVNLFRDIQLLNEAFLSTSGGGGTINLQGNNILLSNGSQIENNVTGAEAGGFLNINGINSVSIIGGNNNLLTGIFSNVLRDATADGGQVTINTKQLLLENGGSLAVGTLSSGNSGNLIINAQESVNIIGEDNLISSILSTSAGRGSTGNGGALIINTQRLKMLDGGSIIAITLGAGRGGLVEINASEYVELIGASKLFPFPTELSVSSAGTGDGGNLTINTNRLFINDKARLSASSFGVGNAGNITINANTLFLNNQGEISAETTSGEGGNIDLNLREYLLLRNNSIISTTAGTEGGGGNGGNINLNSPFIVAIEKENSDITANAFLGNGGNINITATGIYGIQFRDFQTSLSDITASSRFGQSGIVDIDSPDVDVSQGLVDLPTNPIDTSKLIAQNICNKGQESEFIVTGKGGLPPTPVGILTQELVMIDLGYSLLKQSNSESENLSRVQAWHIANNGDILLTQTTELENVILQGIELFNQRDFSQALNIWTQAGELALQKNDFLNYALILNNLSAIYIELGNWEKAQNTLNYSYQIVQQERGKNRSLILAQILNQKGYLEFLLGKSGTAFNTWGEAEKLYQENQDLLGLIRVKINQTQALNRLGLNRQSFKILTEISEKLEDLPPTQLKFVALINYANSLRLTGQIRESKQYLDASLKIAEQLGDQENISQYYLSLANLYNSGQREDQDATEVIQTYEKAIALTKNPILKIQAQLNLLNSLLYEINNNQNLFGAKRRNILNKINNLIPQINSNLEQLVINRATIYSKINYVNILNNLIQLKTEDNLTDYQGIKWAQTQETIPLLEEVLQEAKTIKDPQSEAYILGFLGEKYEGKNQLTQAQNLTKKAIAITEEIKADDIAYLWHSQLGKILKAQGKTREALASYRLAYNILKSLRSDLVIVNKDLQYSFRESVEPIYRDYVSLLLETPSQANLEEALTIMESLQIAELDNFFQDACSTAKTENINQVAMDTAVLYPIILPDRLDLIMSLPGQPLKYYSHAINQEDFESNLRRFKSFLTNTRSTRRNDYLPIARDLYNLLIREIEPELSKNNIKTLAFVLDGSLRNVPMAVLNDGQQFLIEKYAIALSPGLNLLEPKKLPQENLNALLGGLTEARQGFQALPNVDTELQQIGSKVRNNTLLNENFTYENLQNIIKNQEFPIIHLATHGEFSSQAEDTFILTYDDKINAKELEDLLSSGENQIELLVLSACRTAAGDNRAALGLAGIAVRAGARSTLATLWYVDDQATSELMIKFYQELQTPNITKAEALRQAQISLLKNRDSAHPLFWAPYVLVGNWL